MAFRSMLKPLIIPNIAIRKSSNVSNKFINVSVNNQTGIATISMNRKPINALTSESLRALTNTFKELEGNCKGAILTSSLPTIFTGGLDITIFHNPRKEDVFQLWTELQETWISLYSTSYPTVAAINGHAPAGGCLLSMCCEYRVMVNGYKIGMNETALGLVAPFWVTESMKNLIGYKETERALMQGKLYTTEEAYNIGLVDVTASNKEAALTKAEDYFKSYEKVDGYARSLSKMSMREGIVQELRKKQKQEAEEFVWYVCQPRIQKVLEQYILSLKKK